jgi:integrase
MTSDNSAQPISPLRARMIEDMTVRGFAEKTRHDYIRQVQAFAAFLGRRPDTATAEDLRRFQLHQTESGMQPPSINSAVAALRFFFTVTLDRPDLSRRLTIVRYPRRLPAVLSAEEVTRLLQAAPGLKYKAALGTAYGAGLRAAEVVALKVGDIDSERMLLRVERGKGGKDRHAMLSPQLLELLREWWREGRRLGALLPQGWLFPGPQSDRAAVDPPAQPRRPRCRRGRRDQEAGVAAHLAAQLRHAPLGAGYRHPRHPSAARPRQARHHRAVHPRRQYHDPHRDQPARSARAADRREVETRSVVRRPCAARAWRSQTSSIATAPLGARPMPGILASVSSR